MIESHSPLETQMYDGEFHGMTVMILNTKPNLGIRKKVVARALSGICLCCDGVAKKRGLCELDYGRFKAAQADLPPSQRPHHEAKQIRLGKLLGSREIQKLRAVNPFRRKSL
jgi:hypothetical protein